jgi:hypothetical protein
VKPASRATTILACASALIVGGFISLFTAGPALFADGPFGQRPVVAAVSMGGFALAGLVIGLCAPGAWKSAAICMAISAVPVVVFFGRDVASQLPMALLGLGFALGDAAAGVFGVWGGARLRTAQAERRAAAGDLADSDRASA